MSHSVRAHLLLEISEYDATIRRWIPGYETMIDRAASAVASVDPRLVVDLGSGTGALAEAILEHESVGRVELLDIDPEMLAQARTRVARFDDRARCTLRSFDDPLPECDAFSASLSLHHIPTIQAKRELFARAFAALRPGGVLVNADATMPSNEADRAPLYARWVEHKVANGVEESRAWEQFDEWAEEDTYLPLSEELVALRKVGFEAVQIWSDGPIGVVVARKPAS